MNKQRNHWEPFITAQKKVTVKKDHECFFSSARIFNGKTVETATVNVGEGKSKTKKRVYICGSCPECKHLNEVRTKA